MDSDRGHGEQSHVPPPVSGDLLYTRGFLVIIACMRVLLLAAGFGTRLGSFGESTPKGLIQAGPTTLLGKAVIDVFRLDPKPDDVALITNERFVEAYGRWLVDKGYAQRVQFFSDGALDPTSRIGAIGDILLAIEHFGWEDDDLLVVPSDTYYTFSLKSFVDFARRHDGLSTIFRELPKATIADRLGCGVLNGERLIDFVEKPHDPPSGFAAIPFYYYPQSYLRLIRDYKSSGGTMDAPGSLVPWLLGKQKSVFAYITDGETLDVGTPGDMEKLQTLL